MGRWMSWWATIPLPTMKMTSIPPAVPAAAHLWGGTPTASRTPSSAWAAKSTSWNRTTAKTTCTAPSPAKIYDVKAFGDTLLLETESPAGEDGFPGNLKISVRYILTEDNALRMDYRVSSDADTILNLTNHTYFNLDGGGDVLNQKLRIYASRYLEGNNETCPTGNILPVDNTPMDFRAGKVIGRDIDTGFAQTTMVGGGYDHCFVIDRGRGASQSLCAWASSDKTGISMKVYTTQPGVQLYTANFLQDCPSPGKGGVPMQKYGGFALETQHFPCSPSHPEFPSTVLRAGKVFRANTTLRFFTGKQCGKL